MSEELETLVEKARQGDKDALEGVVLGIQDRIYGLALRMLYSRADAEDAAQEILIKVITHLDGFRGDSAFTSWVYRIAVNHLISMRRGKVERAGVTFEAISAQLDRAEAAGWCESDSPAQQGIIAEEMRLSCLMGFLQALDRKMRVAFVLGGVLRLSGEQGAYILDISREAFRKRLSRARNRLRDFMRGNCDYMTPGSRCRCDRIAGFDAMRGWMSISRLPFTSHPRHGGLPRPDPKRLQQLKSMDRLCALFRSTPIYKAPERYLEEIKAMVGAGHFEMMGRQ